MSDVLHETLLTEFQRVVGKGECYRDAVNAVVYYEWGNFKHGHLHPLDTATWARAVVSAYDEGGKIGPRTARILARNLIEG